jgi:hypothetical protein
MIESGDGARFGFEALTERGCRELERDDPIETRITCFPYLAHAARGNKGEELVRALSRAGNEGNHGSRRAASDTGRRGSCDA